MLIHRYLIAELKPMLSRFLNTQHLLSIIILFVCAIWIVFSRVDENQMDIHSNSAPFTGFEAPDFKVANNQGESISLSDYKGQAVLLNYWASWCSPCRAEMPAMERIYQEYKDQGFEILAVNSSQQDDKQKAIDFAKELELSFPILFEEDGSVSKQYQIQALPSSFFIDKDGVIQEIVIGGPMSEALLLIRVQNLLEGNQ
jgi:peroxiredoxin